MPAQPRPRHTVSTQRALTLAQHASRLRACATPSEVALWALLRGRQLGVEFRRQVVLGQRIVDFFAPAHRLAVEVDGGYHQARGAQHARVAEFDQHRAFGIAREAAGEAHRAQGIGCAPVMARGNWGVHPSNFNTAAEELSAPTLARRTANSVIACSAVFIGTPE